MVALFDSQDPRPLHFLGIGGAGMSALALVARRLGVPVTGSDRDPASLGDLRAAGAVVESLSQVAQLQAARAMVYTAAIPADHPELLLARQLGLPLIPRKEALAELVNGQTLVALAGTHGKTTTTVMTTEVLRAAGLHPTGLAGGRVSTWGGNAWLDSHELYVVEADEYDQAFLTLQPTVAVINNVEADHLECYGSVEAMEAAFVEFANRASRVLLGDADAGSRRVAEAVGVPLWRFGLRSEDGLLLTPLSRDAAGSVAGLRFPDGEEITLRLQVPGLHNLRNASAALGVARALEADLRPALDALAEFTGVGRRFERHGEQNGITWVDDYAHHPTEMVAAIAAARQAYPNHRLVVAFQPHLYSRTSRHADAMGIALSAADLVLVTDVYPARELPIPGVTGSLVAEAAGRAGAEVHYLPTRTELVAAAREFLRPGDLLLTLGAGDITRLGGEIRQVAQL